MTAQDIANNNPRLNILLGVISLVCFIGGASGLIPIGEQLDRVTTYANVLRTEGPGSPNLPERPNPKAPGPAVLLVFFAETAALLAGREKDGLVDRRGMWLAAAGVLGSCLVLLALFVGALAFALVGLTTWW